MTQKSPWVDVESPQGEVLGIVYARNCKVAWHSNVPAKPCAAGMDLTLNKSHYEHLVRNGVPKQYFLKTSVCPDD